MTRYRVSVLAASCVLVSIITLGGCSMFDSSGEDPYLTVDEEGFTPILERGSFEDANQKLNTMLTEMGEAFTAAFPECALTIRPGAPDVPYIQESINEGYAYTYNSEWWSSDCSVSDTKERRDLATKTLADVGREYGFDEPAFYNNRDGYIALTAANADGDSYFMDADEKLIFGYEMADRFTAAQLKELAADPKVTPPEKEPDVIRLTPLPQATPPAPSAPVPSAPATP